MYIDRAHLVVRVAIDISAAGIRALTTDMLATMRGRQVTAVVIDISRVNTVDTARFSALRECVRSMVVAGVPATLVGMQPGVAWSLAELDVDMTGLRFAGSLDAVSTLAAEATSA
jgi:rsbT antagonist protein RsbS